MVRKQKSQKPVGRNERHSAAWGKRLSLALVLATSLAYGESPAAQNSRQQPVR